MAEITIRRLPRIGLRASCSPSPLPLARAGEPARIVMGATGRPGPRGDTGAAGVAQVLRHDQTAPSASWVVAHALGRPPLVQVFLATGEQVDADVTATDTMISVVFAAATSGFAIYS
jgi:hypothetical protein